LMGNEQVFDLTAFEVLTIPGNKAHTVSIHSHSVSTSSVGMAVCEKS
jgi:hypothetical protein